MQNNVNLFALAKLGLAGLLVSACVPTYHPPHCATCAPQQVVQYCYVQKPGYVLSQDKYDPNFVPCPPITVVKKVNPDDPDQDDGDDDDDGDVTPNSPSTPERSRTISREGALAETPDQSSGTKGGCSGGGACAEQGDQKGVADARGLDRKW